MASHHPQFDFERWADVFPIETFERREGPRQFDTTKPGDPLDRWKAPGCTITSPADLCQIELVRRRAAETCDLGRAVPVDIFLWGTAPPDKPYLTKLGGVPHRELSKPWPVARDGTPYTFVGQFCFLDSRDIVSERLPGDVMLIFFKDAQSYFGDREDVRIEWSDRELVTPMRVEHCPQPRFPVPELAGLIYRCNEYSDSRDVFEQEGHDQYYLFASTQSTKIGRETFHIQGDPRCKDDEELLCALNSIDPSSEWPFVDLERLPPDQDPREPGSWGRYRMMFGDVGCMYFLIDGHGQVRWTSDCY